MKINIFGSTGIIGTKSLNIINKDFPNHKINLLTANNNYKELAKQANLYKPRYIFLNNPKNFTLLKKLITSSKTKILKYDELFSLLKTSKSDMTLLAISGYESLIYLENIFKNTRYIGLVNKECVVSAGHLFSKLIKKYKTNIYPLDSEHFSLFNSFSIKNKNIKKIYLTASGGPFYNYSYKKLKNVTFNDAVNHPKWKMGYKNSIDSSTLVNKCLELIEAHYLFNIKFDLLDIVIHPQALVHSIIEYKNYTSSLNYFYHDMYIPLYNFFNHKNTNFNENTKFSFKKNSELSFKNISNINFPIYKIFNKMDKKPSNFIKFNVANEYAVELFKDKKIKFGDIHKIIDNSLSFELNSSLNSVQSVLNATNKIKNHLKSKYE